VRQAESIAARRRALAVLCGVLFLTFLDTTIVAVALGDIQADLHAGVTSLQWTVNAYALLFATLMLTAGTLGDRFGRKRLMLGGVVFFGAASLLGALAPSVEVLIAARALMGIGAAASEPGTLSILRHLYPDARERSRAIGTWAAVTGVALAAGPVVGGALVGAVGWRGVFWFNVAFAAVLVPLTRRYVPESSDPQTSALDLPGLVLGALTLGAVTFAIIEGETNGFTTSWILALFAVAGVAAAAFAVVESRSPAPMLDLRFLRVPAFGSALGVAFALYFGIFSIFFFTALYLDEVVGYSGYRAAGEFGPMAAALVAGSQLGGRWVARSGPRAPMTIGCLVAAGGLLLTARFLPEHPSFGPLAVSLAVAGLGFGIAVVPVTSAVLAIVPAARSGMAASATNTMRQLGAVFGVAVLGALVNAHLTSDLADRLHSLGIPANFQSIVINAIETGSIPSGGNVPGSASGYGPIVAKVINAAYGAFHSGLHTALLASAGLILLAAAFSAVAVRRSSAAADQPAPWQGFGTEP
jgi:EmrB/QacA subfamily drug resistance transporter